MKFLTVSLLSLLFVIFFSSLQLLHIVVVVSAERPPIEYLLLNDTKKMSNSQFEKAIDEFHTWFGENYGSNLQVKLRPSEGLRLGVEATARFREGQPYLSVPLRMCIDTNTLSNGPEAPPIFKSFWPWLKNRRDAPAQPNQLLLAIFLIYARWVVPRQTFWTPYIELLPRKMDTPEHAFTDNDIDIFLVGFPRFQKKIREARKKREIEFFWLREHVTKNAKFGEILPKKIFTRPRWSWAMAILNTRMIWWEGGPHLVPMLDMINCYIPSSNKRNNVHETVREGDRAVTRAGYTIQKGDEIYENYGQPNGYYFLNHGFYLEYNPHDCYYITLPRPDRELTRKALFLTGAKIEDGDQLCTNMADQRKTDILFDLARIYTLPDKVLETAIAKRVLPRRDTDKQIRRTIRWMGKRLSEKQKEISKTQEQYDSREQDPVDSPHNELISEFVETMGLPIDDALVELRARVRRLTERIKTREAKRAREQMEAKKKAAEESATVVGGGGSGEQEDDTNTDEEDAIKSIVDQINEKRGDDGNNNGNSFDDAEDKLLASSMRSRISGKGSNQRSGGSSRSNSAFSINNNKKRLKIDDDF